MNGLEAMYSYINSVTTGQAKIKGRLRAQFVGKKHKNAYFFAGQERNKNAYFFVISIPKTYIKRQNAWMDV